MIRLPHSWIKSFPSPLREGRKYNLVEHRKSPMAFTFFTSARRSFFLTGLSLTSAVVCCDLDSADSLSDSEWLSDSEELFDSELCDLLLSLPCSLSDWLPDSDAERLDSSEAEMLQEKEYVHLTLQSMMGYCSKSYVQHHGSNRSCRWQQ